VFVPLSLLSGLQSLDTTEQQKRGLSNQKNKAGVTQQTKKPIGLKKLIKAFSSVAQATSIDNTFRLILSKRLLG